MAAEIKKKKYSRKWRKEYVLCVTFINFALRSGIAKLTDYACNKCTVRHISKLAKSVCHLESYCVHVFNLCTRFCDPAEIITLADKFEQRVRLEFCAKLGKSATWNASIGFWWRFFRSNAIFFLGGDTFTSMPVGCLFKMKSVKTDRSPAKRRKCEGENREFIHYQWGQSLNNPSAFSHSQNQLWSLTGDHCEKPDHASCCSSVCFQALDTRSDAKASWLVSLVS